MISVEYFRDTTDYLNVIFIKFLIIFGIYVRYLYLFMKTNYYYDKTIQNCKRKYSNCF